MMMMKRACKQVENKNASFRCHGNGISNLIRLLFEPYFSLISIFSVKTIASVKWNSLTLVFQKITKKYYFEPVSGRIPP